jgi:hypothetical protein
MFRIILICFSLVSSVMAVPPQPTDGTPEPASLLLLGAGGAAYGLYQRFKK